MNQYNTTESKVVEIESRLQELEQSIERLADSVLKLEQVLDTIASYIVPEDDSGD